MKATSTRDGGRTLGVVVLRNYRHYVRWSNGRLTKDCDGWGYPPPRSPKEFYGAGEAIVNRREDLQRMAPREFPCVGVIQCVSCNYEEYEPFYLYGRDIEAIFAALVKARQ